MVPKIAATFLSLAGAMSCANHAAQNGAESKILSYKQYASIEHKTPYLLEFKVGSGALLLFGAEHTGDPKDPQIAEIERLWKSFQPTMAYNEGGNPPTLKDATKAVETSGEPGFVRYLADRDKVPVATFEPDFKDEVAYAAKIYTPEQVKVFYVLRQVTEGRRLTSDKTVDERMVDWLGQWDELSGAPNTVAEFSALCKRYFPELKDWREVPEDWFDPTQSIHYTNELANATGMFRDQYIYKLLLDRAKRGDRVFAVIGASHVVVQEPAWRATLGEPVLYRNGF
jgi:hypothetical protein